MSASPTPSPPVHRAGDLVWVHDYQLLLVPELLRRRLPTARIGFFLHIPFPSSEVLRTLPHRERLLRRHARCRPRRLPHRRLHASLRDRRCCASLGAPSDVDRLSWQWPRSTRIGVFPMGVDARAARRAVRRDPRSRSRRRHGARSEGAQILLGVDRLDYTKGSPRRLLAFERLLERHPELRERVRLDPDRGAVARGRPGVPGVSRAGRRA